MVFITANELKKRGVSLFDGMCNKKEETIITVRGKSKYVVIDMDTYNQYREYELNSEIAEARKDLKEGAFIEESVDDHIRRIKKNQ